MAEDKKKDKKKLVDKQYSLTQEEIKHAHDQITGHPVVKKHHGQWKEIIAWTDKDEQFSKWGVDEEKLMPVRLVKRKRKVVFNLMKPLSEAIEGKLNMFYQLAGTPNSGEDKDIQASKVSTKLIAHNDYVNDIEAQLEDDFKYDITRTGNVFVKITPWDLGSYGYIKGDNGSVKQDGEVTINIPSVFNIRPDPTAKKREDMRWIIELMEVTKDEILENFDVKEEDLDKQAGEMPEGDGKWQGMNEPLDEKDKKEETYILLLRWERKTTKFPEGRHNIIVGNLELFANKNPALGEIPFYHFGYKRIGNSLWHRGPMHYAQGPQRQVNRTLSIEAEHVEGWRAKMVVPQGAIIKEGAFTTDSFELLEVDTNAGEIRPLNMPELSPVVSKIIDFWISAIDKIANVHEVSYAQLPKYASRAPASLYSMMLEQENIKINPMIKRWNGTLREMGSFRLRLMGKYYKQARLVKIVGKTEETSLEYFKGADLEGNFDVKLVIGVSLHQSRTIQQNLLMELKKQGAPIDWNRIIKMLDLGTIAEELRTDIADITRAERENHGFLNDTYDKDFEKGGVRVYIHDNHEIHLDAHTDFVKTAEVQQWKTKKWDDFQIHINQHFVLIQLEQMQGMMAGAPGARPPSPRPTPAEQPMPGTPGPKPPETRPREAGIIQ